MSLDQKPRTLELTAPRTLDLGDFELLRVLGEGSFGRVRLVKDLRSSKFLVFKQLKKFDIVKFKQVDHLKNENFILSSLSHPFIVGMQGMAQDPRFLYVAMEFVPGGELFTYLRAVKTFPAPQACFYAAQIVLIFEYLHSLNVVYRDLKPENVLLDADGYLKLVDFGFAKLVEDRTYTLCGTPEYLAPEVLKNKGYGRSVDWWTLGVLLYEMIAGVDPFNADDPMEIYEKILARRLVFSRKFDPDSKSLVKHLLEVDLSKRYGNLKNGAQDVKNHRFFNIINWRLVFQRGVVPPYCPAVKSSCDTSNYVLYTPTEEYLVNAMKANDDPFLSWSS